MAREKRGLRLNAPARGLIALSVLMAVMLMFDLALGSVHIPLDDLFLILLGGEPQRPAWGQIVLIFRLPRAVTAMLVGAALSVSGLEMQTLFRNPLAGPFVLGISAGASLGVALVVLGSARAGTSALLGQLGLLGDLELVVAAFLGAAVVFGAVLIVSRQVQSSMTLLILGLMFGYVTNAVVSLLLYFSLAERIQAYLTWQFGSFSGVAWRQMTIFAPTVLLGLLIAYLLAKPLNALLLGESYARSMGLAVKRTRLWIIGSASILAGVTTAFCGPIGFLGLAVPHLCRGLFNTSDHRVLAPAATLMGASLALLADLIAHVPGHQSVLPVNAVTALVGAPVVIWVVLRQRNLRASFAA